MNNCRFRRQHPIGPYIADFACIEGNLIVELDGGQHLDSSSDATRDAWFRARGLRVLRFWNDYVLLRTDDAPLRVRAPSKAEQARLYSAW